MAVGAVCRELVSACISLQTGNLTGEFAPLFAARFRR
jgi:hypothetical protein